MINLIRSFFSSHNSACHGAEDIYETCEESSTVCEAVVRTNEATCDQYCQSIGLTCTEGWDDDDDHTCDEKLTEDSRRTGNGCNQSYWSQICRCETGN